MNAVIELTVGGFVMVILVFIVHGVRNGGYLCRQNRVKTPRLAAGCSLNFGFGERKDHGYPLSVLGPTGILLHVLFQ